MKTTSIARTNNKQRNIGIDISKANLNVYIYELDIHCQTENNAKGIKALISELRRYKLTRILVEATGSYERTLVEALSTKALPVIIVQPIQVRQFAKAQDILAKTDIMNAPLIAQFGAVLKP